VDQLSIGVDITLLPAEDAPSVRVNASSQSRSTHSKGNRKPFAAAEGRKSCASLASVLGVVALIACIVYVVRAVGIG
jgi:hypothetical protein